MGSRITGAEITLLSSTMANGKPTFSDVAWANLRAPLVLNLNETTGSPERWSKLACASVRSPPETRTCFLTTWGESVLEALCSNSESGGIRPASA